MRLLRQVLPGLLVALVSMGIILGALALSFAEGELTGSDSTASPSLTGQTPSLETSTKISTATYPTPSITIPFPTSILSSTPSFTLSSTRCTPPAGWSPYTVQGGEDLEAMAALHGISLENLLEANCLTTLDVSPGSSIYLPPPPTRTAVSCGAPTGWRIYIVQLGDNLYRLSQAYDVTVKQLQNANCLGSSTLIRVGQSLYVPPWPPRTQTPISMPTLTPTGTNAPTQTWVDSLTMTPTGTSTPTMTIMETWTPTVTSTWTLHPTVTDTQTPTETPVTP